MTDSVRGILTARQQSELINNFKTFTLCEFIRDLSTRKSSGCIIRYVLQNKIQLLEFVVGTLFVHLEEACHCL